MKFKIEELEIKEQLIQHEKVEDADKYIKFIKSLRDKPEYIKFVKPQDQTVYMIETALNGSRESCYYNFDLLNYCNHNIINESLILKILPACDHMPTIKNFLKNVPNHCLTDSFFRKLKEIRCLDNEEIQTLKDYFG